MNRATLLALPLLLIVSDPAAAKDPGQEAYMIRMFSCTGTDANMEVYLPQSVILNNSAPIVRALAKPVIGYYTLDLTSQSKGEPLEPVKVAAHEHSGGRRHSRLRSTLRHRRQAAHSSRRTKLKSAVRDGG
jgi:hypothetical protein